MRRLIQRGYPKPTSSLQPSASHYGGLLLSYTLDYAKFMELGNTGSATCYEIKGWYFSVRPFQAFKAYYYLTGFIVRGYGEAEDTYGPYPYELTPSIFNAIQTKHRDLYFSDYRKLYESFSINDVCPIDRGWYCEGCGARFMSKEHGDVYRTCPDHRIVCEGV